MTRWDGERNKSIYEKCGVETCTTGVKCGLVGWMKNNTLR